MCEKCQKFNSQSDVATTLVTFLPEVLVVRYDAELGPDEEHEAGEVPNDDGHGRKHHPDLANSDGEASPKEPREEEETVALQGIQGRRHKNGNRILSREKVV